MDGNVLATIGSAVGVLVGVYSIVNRSEDRITKKMDQRFDDVKEVWRAELRRVEEVLDARLKHLEEK